MRVLQGQKPSPPKICHVCVVQANKERHKMNDQVTTLGHSAGYGISQEERHKVLRNTYWLLALSMIPTVLGAWVIKRDLSGMGKWLMVGALVLMVGAVINVFVGSSVGMMAISVAAIGIFSAYMLYDLKQILDGGETNYISATLALYLDIFNVFQSLLALLGIMGGERE